MDGAGGVLLAALAGYLAGSFPTAVLVTRFATRGALDIRAAGSGNPGGFNTIRSVGRAWGVLVIVVDMAKGALGALAGWAIAGPDGADAAAAATLAGHVFPVWSRFRGGKGIATSGGAVLAVFPAFFPLEVVVAAVVTLRTRRTLRTAQVGGVLWIAAALVWWRAGVTNWWGPEPTAGLVVFAVLGTAVVWTGFALGARPEPVTPRRARRGAARPR